jgi:proton-dependent oligopeptide transporter, POT family
MSMPEGIELSGRTADEPRTIVLVYNSTPTEPTTEEWSRLEHVADRIPLSAWLIVLCELCERFAYYGLSGPFQNYIQFPESNANSSQPGALDRGQQTATALTTFFQFFSYLTPIASAIIADQFWGKYKTILIACIVYMIGLLVLVLSSIPPAIDNNVAFPGLIVAMIIIGIGTGGVKSNVSPLMAEQYTETRSVVRGSSNYSSEETSISFAPLRNQRSQKNRRSNRVSHFWC